jgi:maltooligosyltrehalose trehalohydrolase
MPFGAALLPSGGARFRLWAPSGAHVALKFQQQLGGCSSLHDMRLLGGWHEIEIGEASAGDRYQFLVQSVALGTLAVPDPASRSNPDGVHAASMIVDPLAYCWRTPEWAGRPWPDAVVYELHIGAFTELGTFAAACERLSDLKALGITALQVMPLAAFPGRCNWGYDGVLQFSPASCYGAPSDLKGFIDAAHELEIMVLLDVVYNHFGPEGNYLHVYCPEFFNPAQRTPWGEAINFDGEASRIVRDFFVHNALYWLDEYRFDGLRLDAVHAMRDRSSPDIVEEIAAAIHAGPGRYRQVHLVLENNRNQAKYLTRDAAGDPLIATAQWDDDTHHALHVLVSGEADGYYADYQRPLEKFGRALAEGFAFQGEHSVFRDRARGEPSRKLPPAAFVGFLQNHDMVGNRAFGDRIPNFADPQLLPAAYACLLLSPQIPMLFMGEEFAASTPFMFFCDFGADLAASVAAGRRREFRRFTAFADEAAIQGIPDPNAASTFEESKLRWREALEAEHQDQLQYIRQLLALRQRYLAPLLSQAAAAGRFDVAGGVLHVEWRLPDATWSLLANFGKDAAYSVISASAITVFSLRVAPAAPPQARLERGSVIVSYDRV